ncbi:hypothetical protein [Prosthecochloris sp.]|uniref:hypothetical protein n=1 Tax=Prosthecochloris sp. TaxID=290513 RepID=UPI0025E0F666|nr:hypothetical protein [Prosthecochloris sp.]
MLFINTIARFVKKHVFGQPTTLDVIKKAEDATRWNKDLFVTYPGGLPRTGGEL